MVILNVYTLNEEEWSYQQLFRLWREASGDGLDVQFDFTGCGFLRQNAVAFLGGLARLIEYRGGRVTFAWDTLHGDVGANLAQNGFMQTFGGPRESWMGNSIPFRHDPLQDAHEFENYLTRLWLGRGWVNVSPALASAIVGNMAEIYLNAFEHGQSPIGVFACGQHFPKNRELNLTIVDFGVGIPSNVRLFKTPDFQPEQLSAASCVEWAFQNGTSTKQGDSAEPRGLGLDLLHDFVRQNGGRLEMFSHEGYALIADGNISFADRRQFFEGTLVNISLKCDESYYCLASEIDKEPLF
jgi:hypothetical protein